MIKRRQQLTGRGQAQRDRLKRLVKKHYDPSKADAQLAARLGLARGAVIGELKRQGLYKSSRYELKRLEEYIS